MIFSFKINTRVPIKTMTSSYAKIPEKKRHEIQFDLYCSAYPKEWVRTSGIHTDEKIEKALSKVFRSLKKHEKITSDMYDQHFMTIEKVLLSGYKRSFRHDVIYSCSWGESISDTIRLTIDELFNIINN